MWTCGVGHESFSFLFKPICPNSGCCCAKPSGCIVADAHKRCLATICELSAWVFLKKLQREMGMYEGQKSENQKFLEMYTRERGCENSDVKAIVACESHQGGQQGKKGSLSCPLSIWKKLSRPDSALRCQEVTHWTIETNSDGELWNSLYLLD